MLATVFAQQLDQQMAAQDGVFLLNNDGLFYIHILGDGINTIQYGYYNYTSIMSLFRVTEQQVIQE